MCNITIMAKRNILIENERTVTKENLLFEQVKQLLDDARTRIARTVNTTIVNVYWQIGKYIVEYEQGGQGRAAFGKDIINKLSERLTKEYGKGFSPANIRYMRQFYQCFPFCHALSDKLTCVHPQSSSCHTVCAYGSCSWSISLSGLICKETKNIRKS